MSDFDFFMFSHWSLIRMRPSRIWKGSRPTKGDGAGARLESTTEFTKIQNSISVAIYEFLPVKTYGPENQAFGLRRIK